MAPNDKTPPPPEPDYDAAAERSGELGADKPPYKDKPIGARREADRRPNPAGPEFEEGGQYPGKRPQDI
ncbi:hypothetical protein PIGHUM_01775 [Pigmentiphaga humi]|uniref:Uncharacterized protein n=1 Tax=Pigmentiphaga humi TaxID=2478468 RepID=A0A3P4B0Y9_9BURK|nr:hypothetical protein [Pigmentiphaga humi]VCU69712.1 hypothetical protein PIGHUM_01775 [Pigmentiphaga humi]